MRYLIIPASQKQSAKKDIKLSRVAGTTSDELLRMRASRTPTPPSHLPFIRLREVKAWQATFGCLRPAAEKMCDPMQLDDSQSADQCSVDAEDREPPSSCRLCRSQRRGSASSLYYYASSQVQKCQHPSVDPLDGATTFATTQSQRIPTWLWVLVARCLRIPVPGENRLRWMPSVGLVLQAATLLSALGFSLCNMWYEVRAIVINHDRQDALHRCVSIFVVLAWCSFGMYGRRLARRLFSHPSFLRDIRMHAKTVFKINAAALAFLAGVVFVVSSCYNARDTLEPGKCASFGAPWGLCLARFVSRVVFSVFALVWNGLVCVVVVSVCRTHTIGIRRFIRELERDAILYEMHNSHLYRGSPVTSDDICQESIWIEDEGSDGENVYGYNRQENSCPEQIQTNGSGEYSATESKGPDAYDAGDSIDAPELCLGTGAPAEGGVSVTKRHPRSLSVPEILQSYWKISCRLRLTGIALQRWVASLVGLAVVWCSATLISWLKTTATVYEIVEFVSPLVILLLVCSCLAEVNMEGVRMLRCLRPTKDRLAMMNYLTKSPLQLVTFGFAVSYGTIMTVVLGILVAFISRLIIIAVQGL